MKTINNALKKIQKGNTNNRVLYRGFAGPEHMTTQEFIKSYDIGDEIITQKITSTSLSPEVAKSFSKKAIHCPSIFVYRSKKGAYIKDLSSSPQEEEVVIPVGKNDSNT